MLIWIRIFIHNWWAYRDLYSSELKIAAVIFHFLLGEKFLLPFK